MVQESTDVAWAAGLFEGEGHFGKKGQASLASIDEDVVRRFHKIVGVGTVIEGRTRVGRPFWNWRVSSRDGTLGVGELFEPFLSERRRAQLEVTREWYSRALHSPKKSAAMFKVWEQRREQHGRVD